MDVAAAPPARLPANRRPRVRRGRSRVGVGAVAGLAAIGGGVAGVSPSGTPLADILMGAVAAGAVAMAATRAHRWTWFVAGGTAAAAAGGALAAVCAGTALAIGLAASATRPGRVVGAIVGALVAQALLRLADWGPHGTSSAIATVAVLPLLLSGYRQASRRGRRLARGAMVVLAVMVVGAGAAFAAALREARPAVERARRHLDAGVEAARQGDDATAEAELVVATEAYRRAERSLGGWPTMPARLLPIVGHNALALHDLVDGAADMSAQAAHTAGASAGLGGLSVRSGRVDVDAIARLAPDLDRVATTLARTESRVAAARGPWVVDPLARRIEEARTELAELRPDAERAAQAARALPALLGHGEASRWFVAFVTPTEARGRTGFLGNWAELTVTDGRIAMTRFGRSTELEAAAAEQNAPLEGPSDYVSRWGRFAPAPTWRNVTVSPDFPSVGEVITNLYPRSGGQPIDGVISIDPTGLAALLQLAGPVEVPALGRTVTAGNAAEFLHVQQYVELPDTPARVDALETIARAAFDRLLVSDLSGPAGMGDALGPAVEGGHIQLYTPDPEGEALLASLGLDGALPPVRGDALAVVGNNAAGNKVDLFAHRHVSYDVTWDPETGDVTATATVTLANKAPPAGLPEYVIGSPLDDAELPQGGNRSYLSLYTPWSLAGATLDGRPVTLESARERGRNAYSLVVEVPPGGERALVVTLEGRLAPDDGYRLDVAAQPSVNPDVFDLDVTVPGRGRLTWSGDLVRHVTPLVLPFGD